MVCSSFLKANAGLATEKARKGYRTDYKNCTATAPLYMNTALPPELFRMTRGKSAPWCQAAPQFAYLLSTSTSRLLNLLKIIELTRDRIGEGFSLMESLRHDIDHAKRADAIPLSSWCSVARMKGRSAEIRGNLLSPWICGVHPWTPPYGPAFGCPKSLPAILSLRSIQATYLRRLFLGQY